MPPRIPVELAQARETLNFIQQEHIRAIDEERPRETIERLLRTGKKLEDIYHDWYVRWQALGGTSDIVSIVAAENKAAEDENLGTRFTISGGEVLELDAWKGGDDLPF